MSDIEKMPLASMDVAAERIEKLKEIFPEAFVEGKVDHDALLRSLGQWVEPGKERFGLTWPGKAECMKVIQAPSVGTLLPMRDESVNFNTSENLIIEGDNLEVLKLLQKSYFGKVKMIYIDPPYNTGNEFIYPDDYAENLKTYLMYTGQVDAEGRKFSTNTEAGGRFHSNWLRMLHPRLYLAKNLLKDDGVIFVSIDDSEVHNLRSLMNEIFGEENFVANVIWQKKYTRSNDAKWFSDNHDHILVFSKNKEIMRLNLLARSEDQITAYSNPDNHWKGVWKATPLHAKSGISTQSYTFKNGIVWAPPLGTFRRYSDDTMAKMDDNDEIWFGADLKTTPSRKSFLSEVKEGITPVTIWPYDEVGHNHEANSELKTLIGEGVFDNPKPSRLIRRMLELTTNPNNNDVVLDFFAGSGTTAHSALELNKSDGGNRKYILVQLPEKTDNPDFPTIADITRERVRRVIKKLNDDDEGKLDLDGSAKQDRGFKSLKLSSSNFKVWEGSANNVTDINETLSLFADNILPDRSSEDILYELLLKAGSPLTAPIEKLSLAGKDVYSIAEGALLICLDKELTLEVIEAMVERKPVQILCLDEGFKGNDQLKVNAVQTVKAYNRNEESDIVFRVV